MLQLLWSAIRSRFGGAGGGVGVVEVDGRCALAGEGEATGLGGAEGAATDGVAGAPGFEATPGGAKPSAGALDTAVGAGPSAGCGTPPPQAPAKGRRNAKADVEKTRATLFIRLGLGRFPN